MQSAHGSGHTGGVQFKKIRRDPFKGISGIIPRAIESEGRNCYDK